jgi:hypothetical protein
LRGLQSIPETAYDYLKNTSYSQMGSDALDLGKNVYHDITEHPIENLLGALPIVGSGMAAYDAYKLNDRIKQAYASGNHEDAKKLERALVLSSLGAIPIFGELSSVGSSAARMAEEAMLHGAAETGSRAIANSIPRDAYQVAENIALIKINQALDSAKKHMFSNVSDKRITSPNIGGDRGEDVRSNHKKGGRTLGNNAIDNAMRMALNGDAEIEMPHSLKELQDWKKNHPTPVSHPSMDDVFTNRVSGFEGAPPIAMPSNLDELLAYLRKHHASGGRAHFDDGGDVRGGDSPFMSRADYGLGSANARSDEAPSFRQAEDRSMEAYNRAVESGWSPTGGDGGGGWGSSVPSVPSEGMMGRGLPAETPKTDVSPFGFGRRDVVFGQDFLGQAPQNIRQWTQQRLDTVPENIYEAAKDPSLYYGMGYPGVVGKQPSRAGVAGLLGTLYGESTYDPTAINPESGAVGMAQYLGSRKQDFLRAMGINEKKPTDAQLEQALAGTAIPQMGYIINEMLTQPGYRPSSNQYLTGTNPSRVTDVLTRNFERPSETEIAESSARRAAEARSIYAGETVPTAPSDPIKEALLSRVGLPVDRSGYQRVASNLRPDSMGTTNDVTEDTDQVSVDTSSADKSNDIYRNLMDMPGFGSEDPAQIAAYNQAVSKALGYATGPQSVYNVFAAGQRTPQTDTFGGKLSGILEDAFSPKFVGVNDPNYAKMIQQKDDFNRPVQEGGGGRDAADILAARAAAAPAGSQAALAPYLTELSSGNLALPNTEGLTAKQWADQYAGGDMSKVHARIKYVNGAPRLEYYTV